VGAHVRPDPWPSPDIVFVNLDACSGSVSLLEGEQNINLPHVGSEQGAAQTAPQIFFILTTPTLAESTASVRLAGEAKKSHHRKA